MRAKLTHTRRLSPPPSQHISYSPHFTTPRNNKVVRNPAHTRRLPPPSQQMLKAVNAGIKLTYTPEEQGLFDKIIAESVAMSKSEKLRSSSSGGRRRQPRISKLRAESEQKEKTDLIRMYEECKQAGVVVEVAAEEKFSRITSVDVIRPVLSSKSGASTTPSSPLRAQEVLAQRIAAMHRSKNAADLGDRRQPDSDPAELRKGEGEIENTRLSMVSLRDLLQGRDDCCGHTPRPRSFVMVDHRKKQKGLAGLFGWLKGACHRASMLIPRTCARA